MSTSRKRKHGKPDRFQPVEARSSAADEVSIVTAIQAFIERFVSPERRDRASHFLIPPSRRHLHLREALSWVDPQVCTDVDGSAGFPRHLADRFGPLSGILISDSGAVHITLPEAASWSDDSIFVSDDHSIAVLFFEVGSPTLCSSRSPGAERGRGGNSAEL